ncbi:MAG: hypothetical protein PHI63_00780 [Patescibacteria group bacterium]|nr:hypothetical protein [Patescibacteria group bacterium]
MKKKMFAYLLAPAMAFVLLGTGTAFARGWFWGAGNATPEEMKSRYTAMFQQQADMLGLTVTEVKDAWAQGKNLSQLAQEHGISTADLQTRMRDWQLKQMKSQLQVLVDQGVITQAQADARAKIMEQQPQRGGKRMGMGMMGLGKMHW